MAFVKAQAVSLGSSSSLGGESFVQKLLADDPSLLGLGDLVLRGKERVQQSSGRLDLLLESADSKRWYEVEVQLGATNESHIIRTIEYWDNERRHRPSKEHIAVIVAEQITSRFFNVISLFNQHIPLIAIKMTALDVGGNQTLHFTKVLDHSVQEEDVEDVYLPADRGYWQGRASEETLHIADKLIQFAREKDPSVAPKYNKGYIGTTVGGVTSNFITLRPQKKSLRLSIFSPQTPETNRQFTAQGLEFEYEDRWQKYVLYLKRTDLEAHQEFLRKYIIRAYELIEGANENTLQEKEG